MYTWPVPVKHDVLEGISQRTGLNGPMSLSLVCDRSTSHRYFTKQVKYRYQCSEWQSLPTPTHSCTSVGDDTSPCDWGADESKLVSALQGAICGWRNPGWDWWVSLCVTVLDYELLYRVKWAPEGLLAPLRGYPQQEALGLKLGYHGADILWVLQHSQNSLLLRIFTVCLKNYTTFRIAKLSLKGQWKRSVKISRCFPAL